MLTGDLLRRRRDRLAGLDDARTRAPDGLGLGLSIAHDVARRHGFAMAMKESPAGGLEVEFTGPRARLPLEGGGAAKALGASAEVLSGLNEKDEIITGSYKVIRTIRNEAKIKVENNKGPLKAES